MSNTFGTRSMKRRHFLATSARIAGSVAGAGVLLDACSTSPTTPGKTTVTVMYTSTEFTPAYVKEFETLNPDITIRFLESDQTRLNAMLISGQALDFVEGGGVTETSNLVARGLATNLDPYIAQSKVLNADTLLPINDVWRFDGKVQGQGPHYGIVKDWSLDGMFWCNTRLFDQANVPHLSVTESLSYEDLLTTAKKLTVHQKDKTTVYGMDILWGNQAVINCTIMQMMAQQGAFLFNHDLTAVDFTVPEAIKALQWYVDYSAAGVGYGPLNPNPANSPAPTFLANRLASTEVGYWFTGEVATDTTGTLAQHVALVPAPTMGSNRFSASFGAVGAWIPAASKQKDAAWKVMEYFMAGTPARDRAKSGWGFPSLKPLLSEVPQTLPYQQQSYQAHLNDANHLGVLRFSPYITSLSMFTSINKYMLPVFQGQAQLVDAAKQITDEVNATLQHGKQQLG